MVSTPDYEAIMKRIERNTSRAQDFMDELDQLLQQHNLKIEVEGWIAFIFDGDTQAEVDDSDIKMPDTFTRYKADC